VIHAVFDGSSNSQVYSSILNKVSNDSNLTVRRSVLMVLLFSHLHWRRSNGHNRILTRARIRLKDQCQELPRIRYLTHLVSCQAQRIRPIRRVNIPFLEASTAMPLTQRRSHSFPVMVAFRFLKRCPIMAPLITDLRTMVLPISNTMPSLHLNNSTTTEWVTIWLDRVQTTLCHLIMHLLTWLIGR
jgi:hypothetical protein